MALLTYSLSLFYTATRVEQKIHFHYISQVSEVPLRQSFRPNKMVLRKLRQGQSRVYIQINDAVAHLNSKMFAYNQFYNAVPLKRSRPTVEVT